MVLLTGFILPQAHLLVLCYVSLMLTSTLALDNGVGRTPAMGWNSWNFFRCQINETLIREVADAMVASGLRDAGYVYVNIDDCWMEKRGPDGRIQPFKDKFPSGMKALADYIHSKGLKFGVYSDTGNKTCEGYPGSWGYEKLDAQTYAEWGVDYLKYDYCGMDKANEPTQTSYERMRDALLATGRPILYSLCSWGAGQPWLWGSKVGNSWRAGIDTFAAWDDAQAKKLKLPSFLQPVMRALKAVEDLHQHAGPGGFNDPDMLVVGLDGMYPYGIVQECPEHIKGCKPGEYISRERWGKVGGLTVTEQKTHFAFWCMLSSPLILGNDPRHMSQTTLSILTAPEILAISQDKLGKQARKVWSQDPVSIWVKPLTGDRLAVLLFNAGSEVIDISLNYTRDLHEWSKQWERDVPGSDPDCQDKLAGCKDWAKHGECGRNPGFMLANCLASCPEACPHPLGPPGPKATAMVRDAWGRDDLGPHVALFTAHLVEPHEARVLTLQFVEPSEASKWKHVVRPLERALQQTQQTQQAVVQAARGPSEEDIQRMVSQRVEAQTAPLKKQVEKLQRQVSQSNKDISEMEALTKTLTEKWHQCEAREQELLARPRVTAPVIGGMAGVAVLLLAVGCMLLSPNRAGGRKPGARME